MDSNQTHDAAEELTAAEWAQEVLAEIAHDVLAGHIPLEEISTFADLHEHVDANTYGEEIPEGEGDNLHALWAEVQDLVDAMIKDGRLAAAVEAARTA